jgi:hypothetical protein
VLLGQNNGIEEQWNLEYTSNPTLFQLCSVQGGKREEWKSGKVYIKREANLNCVDNQLS